MDFKSAWELVTMRNILSISNIYLLLVICYQLQGVLYEGGNTFSRGIAGFFFIFSAMMALYANIRYKLPVYFKGLNVLLGMFILYGVIHISTTSTDYVRETNLVYPSYNYLLAICLSIMPIYVFYIATIKKEFDSKHILLWTFAIIVLSIAKFLTKSGVDDVAEVTNNMGYLFVGIIPLIPLLKNKTITQYILLIICMVMIILSMKRGAILVASCSLIPFIISQWKQNIGGKQIVLLVMTIAFFIGIVYFVQYMLQNSDYMLERLEATKDGDSSKRDLLFFDLWHYFTDNASLTEQLFGGGANRTLLVSDNYAHNDWLEILINQGILGIIIYVFYWIKFYQEQAFCRNIHELNNVRISLIICLIASFLMTFFSMSYGDLPIGMTLALGICLGQITLYQTEKNHTYVMNYQSPL